MFRLEHPLGNALHVVQRDRLDEAVALFDVVDADIFKPTCTSCSAILTEVSKRNAYDPVRNDFALSSSSWVGPVSRELADFRFHHFESLARRGRPRVAVPLMKQDVKSSGITAL